MNGETPDAAWDRERKLIDAHRERLVTDPYVPTTEEDLRVRATEYLAENPQGDRAWWLIKEQLDEIDRLQSLLATAGADTLREAADEINIDWPVNYEQKGWVQRWLHTRADSMEGKAHDQ